MKSIKFIAVACAAILAAGSFAPASAKDAPAEDIKIVKVNDSNFEKEVLQSKKPVILDITSTSCPPCLIMIPTLIGIAKNYSDIKIATVGIDEPGIDKIKATLPIRAFPTFFMVRDGKVIDQLVGAVKEEELLRALKYTPSPLAKAAKPKKVKNASKSLVSNCVEDGSPKASATVLHKRLRLPSKELFTHKKFATTPLKDFDASFIKVDFPIRRLP